MSRDQSASRSSSSSIAFTAPRPSRAARAASKSRWHPAMPSSSGSAASLRSGFTTTVGVPAPAAAAGCRPPTGVDAISAIGTVSPATSVDISPDRRTVTTPIPATVAVALVQVEDAGGVLVHPQDEDVVGQLGLEGGQAPLAHVAEPGVVVAALGVVEVRHDHRPQAHLGHQVEAVQPVRPVAHLVDLVHRQGVRAQGAGGGAGKGDGAAGAQLLGQDHRHLAAGPLLQGVGRAAGPGEHVGGLPQPGQHLLVGDRVGVAVLGGPEGRHAHGRAARSPGSSPPPWR